MNAFLNIPRALSPLTLTLFVVVSLRVGVRAQEWARCSNLPNEASECSPGGQVILTPDTVGTTACVGVESSCKVAPTCEVQPCTTWKYPGGWIASTVGQSCADVCPSQFNATCKVDPMNAVNTASKVETLAGVLGFYCNSSKTVDVTGLSSSVLAPAKADDNQDTCFFSTSSNSDCVVSNSGAIRFCCCGDEEQCNNLQVLPATPTPTPTPTIETTGGWVIATHQSQTCNDLCPNDFSCNSEAMGAIDITSMATLSSNVGFSCLEITAVVTHTAPYFLTDGKCFYRLPSEFNPARCDTAPDSLTPTEPTGRKICCCGAATGPGSCAELQPLF